MNHFAISALVTAITTFILAIFVITRNPASRLYRIFAFYSFSITMWSSCVAIHGFATVESTSLLAAHLLHIGASLIPVTFVHFVFIFIDGNIQGIKKKILQSMYLVSLFFITMSFTPAFVNRVATRYGIPFLMYPGNIFYHLSVTYFVVCVCYGLYRMFLEYIHSSGIRHNQMKYLFWSSLLGYIGGLDNYLIIYDIKIFPLYPYGTYAVALYVIITAYAILKYRLLDINTALTRAGNFLIVYALVLGAPFLLGYRYGLWKTATWTMLVLATIGPFIYQYLKRKTENILLKEQRRYQETLRRASKDMTLIKDLKHLLKLMVHILTKTIRINYAAIYLYDEKNEVFILKANNGDKFRDTVKSMPKDTSFIKCLSQIKNPILIEDLKNTNGIKDIEEDDINKTISLARSINATLIIPSLVDNQMLGFLVLGNKISGHTYTDDDLAVLSVLANQAALAIENAQFYEKAKIMEAERIQSEKFATIGRLATSAKHEINNPLQMICWNFDDMSMRLKDTENNFHNVKERLDETVKSMREMILAVTDNNTLEPEILHGLDEVNNIFNETLLILDSRGMAETEFVNKINNMCARVEANKICLTKACENITDEKLKDKIDGIIHSSGTLSKNVMKIRDAEKTLWKNIKSAKENAKRIENQTQIMHDLPSKLDKELTAIDVNKLIEAAFGFAKQQTYWENLGDTPVEKNIPANCPKIRGYFARLQSVFLNLIMNAYQAMTDAGLKSSRDRLIKISANIDPKSDNFLEIHFSNKGPLIPKENLERIFERDFTTKKEGHGLGLSISRIHVELNNGTIHAKNIEGFGPEFIVRLPIWKEA